MKKCLSLLLLLHMFCPAGRAFVSKGCTAPLSGNDNAPDTVREGFVVFKNDTIRGVIWLFTDQVELKTAKDHTKDSTYIFTLSNKALTTIMMYDENNNPMYFVRLRDSDTYMARAFHIGKLSIYDDRIAYITQPGDIDQKQIKVVYDGELDDFSQDSPKSMTKKIARLVNKIYGLELDANTITWDDLLVKIDALD